MAGDPDLTVEEVADHLRLNKEVVRRHLRAGHFPHAYQLGRNSRWRIPLGDLQAFKEERRREK